MKRPLAIVLVLVAAVLSAFYAVGSSAAAPPCTRIGTDGRNVIAGGPGRDVICARAGNDYVHANGGPDLVRGGSGNDVLVGGRGRDTVRGHGGQDRIFLVDGRGGGLAAGGRGRDVCFVDRGDRVRSCEEIHRGISVELANSLSSAFFDTVAAADEIISDGAPPTVTRTETVTVTVSFPPCTPPPLDPPPPCGTEAG